MTDNVIDYIQLSLIFSPASIELDELMKKYHNPKEILELAESGKSAIFSQRKEILEKSRDILDFCRNNSVEIITPDSEFYPEKLKSTDCPPVVLYCTGDVQSLTSQLSVAVVGARQACSYSLECATYFSKRLAEKGVLIVSGFANGTDSSAHEGAIKAGGKTIAVLGCGVFYDYPKNKSALKNDISKNGAVISEYPPLEPAKPEYFKVRNRIISGISDCVLVCQAGKKSGAVNTVSHALEQGREVYVIPPHDIFDRSFDGQSLMIKDGARVVFSPAEIYNDISGV